MTLFARVAFAALCLMLLPFKATAETMEGVIDEVSHGSQVGGFSLWRGRDRIGFFFRNDELRIEGVHWSNLVTFPKPGHLDTVASIRCPRPIPCIIFSGKTHVRVQYVSRGGDRYATNIVALDPQLPNRP
jgi:hypothetical protein